MLYSFLNRGFNEIKYGISSKKIQLQFFHKTFCTNNFPSKFSTEHFPPKQIFHLSTHSLNIWVSHYLLGLVCILYFNSGVCWIEWRVGICRRHRVLPPLSLLVQPLLPPWSKTFAFFMACVFWKVWPKDLHIYVCLSVCWDVFLHLSKLSAQVYT